MICTILSVALVRSRTFIWTSIDGQATSRVMLWLSTKSSKLLVTPSNRWTAKTSMKKRLRWIGPSRILQSRNNDTDKREGDVYNVYWFTKAAPRQGNQTRRLPRTGTHSYGIQTILGGSHCLGWLSSDWLRCFWQVLPTLYGFAKRSDFGRMAQENRIRFVALFEWLKREGVEFQENMQMDLRWVEEGAQIKCSTLHEIQKEQHSLRVQAANHKKDWQNWCSFLSLTRTCLYVSSFW